MMEGQRIRIKLKAYEHAMLDRTTNDIVVEIGLPQDH